MRQATESIDAGAGPVKIPAGTVIGGRFRVESIISRESGSVVYHAVDTGAGTPWTLRVIPLSVISNGPPALLAEISKTQALRHKNLVDVEAVGQEGDFLYVATEFVDGQSLRAFIDGKRAEGRGVSLKGAANLVAHVSNALEYAKRISVHGALNPAIIWVNRSGRVKVSGLGIARGFPGLARHGAPEGVADTVYCAPELLAGGPISAAADVYALGVILYELLTGKTPGSPYRPASSVASEVPAAIDGVIERAIARDPNARWPSTAAMKDALQAASGLAPAAPARNTGAAATQPQAAPAQPQRPVAQAPQAVAAPAVKPSPSGLNFLPAAAPAQPAAPMIHPAMAAMPAAPAAAPGATAGSGPAANGGIRRSHLGHPAVAAPPWVPGPEDNIEKWLVQKDRLDFGPFSMVQLRAQIERGEFLPEHVLMDNDAGTRCRIKDYPGLGDLAKHAHRRLEQARRAQAEQKSEKSEKKKSLFTAAIVGIVLLAVAGGITVYVVSRRDGTDGGRLASREEEAEIESFLKGVKIGGMKASVRRGGGHRTGGSNSGGAAEDFNNDSNFGDASKGFAEGDQTLDDDQIQNTMMSNYRKLVPCIMSSGAREIAMEFVVRGNGKVSAVKVNGQRTGSLPGCVLGRMQSFSFPKFNGSKTIASWSMSMK
jgi:hypothetical protein